MGGILCVAETKGQNAILRMVQGNLPAVRHYNMKGQRLGRSNIIAHVLANCCIAGFKYYKCGLSSRTGNCLIEGHSGFEQDAKHYLIALVGLDCVAKNSLYALIKDENFILLVRVLCLLNKSILSMYKESINYIFK